jgi:hypothetical protein
MLKKQASENMKSKFYIYENGPYGLKPCTEVVYGKDHRDRCDVIFAFKSDSGYKTRDACMMALNTYRIYYETQYGSKPSLKVIILEQVEI